MKAISLWEPWGTAIAVGLKRIETRHWPTRYRGPFAIHCAKTKDHSDFIFAPAVGPLFKEAGITDRSHLNFGHIVATCLLVDCQPTEVLLRRKAVSAIEELFGNYDPHRFGWVFAEVKRLAVPVPWRGAQGFFEVPDSVLLNP